MGKKNTRPSFQFHKGTIKTMSKRTRTVPLCHFNSIKVRLKRNGSTFNMSSDEFQFHKGTIKTHCLGIYNILVFNRICECKVMKSY